jgi:hypothetical protein
VYWMEIDVIHGKHEGLVFICWRLVAPMTLERKVIPTHRFRISKSLDESDVKKYGLRILLIDVSRGGRGIGQCQRNGDQ